MYEQIVAILKKIYDSDYIIFVTGWFIRGWYDKREEKKKYDRLTKETIMITEQNCEYLLTFMNRYGEYKRAKFFISETDKGNTELLESNLLIITMQKILNPNLDTLDLSNRFTEIMIFYDFSKEDSKTIYDLLGKYKTISYYLDKTQQIYTNHEKILTRGIDVFGMHNVVEEEEKIINNYEEIQEKIYMTYLHTHPIISKVIKILDTKLPKSPIKTRLKNLIEKVKNLFQDS